MYSFYGGRPGNSFVIITTFKSVQEMVDAFSQGPDYTVVHYDEHVLINTDNKNDPDNGKLFRRGYDFQNQETGGAEYIGTIVGPAGRAPILELTNEDTITAMINQAEDDPEKEIEEQLSGTGQYSVANNNLVPGKTADNNFNDKITWKYLAIRNSNGEDSNIYIGFTFPYMVLEIESEPVSPYNNNGVYQDNSGIVKVFTEDDPDEEDIHPFYNKWKIKIPKGIKGNSFGNLQVEKVIDDSIQPYGTSGQMLDDKQHGREVLTYQVYNYDKYENGNDPSDNRIRKYYLGDYNMIKSINMNDKGTFEIQYTHNDTQSFKMKWIDSITIDQEGTFTINYNYGDPYITNLKWLNDISIDQTTGKINKSYSNGDSQEANAELTWITGTQMDTQGNITINYNNKEPQTLSSHLKWIDNIRTSSDGSFIITYNDGQQVSTNQKIKWINNISLDTDGTFVITYNDASIYQPVSKIKWVDYLSLGETGSFKVTYNDRTQQSFGPIKWLNNINVEDNGDIKFTWNNAPNTPQTLPGKIKWIKNVGIKNTTDNNQDTKQLYITWNDNSTLDITEPINDIIEMAINDNNELLVRYSDPSQRINGQTWNGKTGWTNLGNVSNIGYNGGSSASNLNWTGMGTLYDAGAEQDAVKVAQFTMVPTQLLSSNITNITATAGLITIMPRGSSTPITGFDRVNITSTDVQISKTFSGITFEVPTQIAADGAAVPQFVDILIENLSLSFS